MRAFTLLTVALIFSVANAQQWNWAVDAGGGGNSDFCFGIATDSQGNAYWAGSVSGTADFGCGTITAGTTIAGVVAKYDVNGACQWVRGITVGFNDAWAYGIAIDAEDRVYVTGSYNGTATFGNGITLSPLGSDDIFVARYNVDGDCLWARRAGSSASNDEARGIALSAEGDVFITGFSGGTTINFDGITVPNPGNFRQIIVARYDSTGTVQWAKASTGNGQSKSARSISVAGDRLFVTGQFSFVAGSFDGIPISTSATSGKAYVLACDLDGNGLWANSYGSGDHEGMGVAADTLGNVFMVGRMWGSMHLPNDTLVSVSSNDDILLMGLDRDGNYRWAKSTGSTQRDLGWDVQVDGMGNAYMALQFLQTTDFFGTSLTSMGEEEIAIAKVEADGDVVWVARAGGFARDVALCLHRHAVAPHALYFGGYYWGTVTYGSSTITHVGNGDAMMISTVDTTFDISLYSAPVCLESCTGEAVVFTNGDGPFTFSWSNGSTAPTLDGVCVGCYFVDVTDANGQVRRDTVCVEEYADPGYVVQVLDDSLWVAGGTSWQWYYNGTTPVGEDSSSYVAVLTGSYSALVTDDHGCNWNSDTALVVLNVGIEERAMDWLDLWPNPATDEVRVRADGRVVAARAMDVSGRRVPLRSIGPTTILVNELVVGMWILALEMDDGARHFVRLVKR